MSDSTTATSATPFDGPTPDLLGVLRREQDIAEAAAAGFHAAIEAEAARRREG